MTRILVLGGGQQGRVIAADLAASLPAARVTVADVARPELPRRDNLGWIEADLADADGVARLVREHDLAVGALPSRFGYQTMRAAIEARRPLVDVSFCAEDPLALDAAARAADVAILPDCGLAPGLSHLLVGRAFADGGLEAAVIEVGGVARDPARPYGYVITWSVDDLLEEYVRPARVVRDGRVAERPVFSELERVEIDGVGTMESFLSDGLRTLLETLPGVATLEEKTLRWPGHVAAIRPLLESGRLVAELRARCTADPPDDLVVLRVRVRHRGEWSETLLVDRYDAATRRTAMSRTTALTTSACAQLVAAGLAPPSGVFPLERVGRNPAAFEFIERTLARHGVRWARKTAVDSRWT